MGWLVSKWAVVLRFTGIGWYIGLCIALGAVGGIWLDGKFATEPWLTIIGLIAGVFVAFFGMYRMLEPAIKESNSKENG